MDTNPMHCITTLETHTSETMKIPKPYITMKLEDIAKAGKGIFVRANNSQSGVQEVFDQINKLEKAEYNEAFFSDYEDRFQIFILAALVLIFGEVLIANRKGRLAGKIKLFSSKPNINR